MKINLPSLSFWFRRKPLLIVTSFVFAGVLGVVGGAFEPNAKIAVLAAIAGFGVWHWYDAAEEVRKDERDEKRDEFVDEILQERRNLPLRGQDLSALSDETLKIEALKIAGHIRAFEAEYQFDPTVGSFWRLSGNAKRELPEAARSELWRQEQNLMLEKSRRRDQDYRTQLWPDVLPLWEELVRRVGPFQAEHSQPALGYGSLAGPCPLEDGAQEIEALARRLKIEKNPG